MSKKGNKKRASISYNIDVKSEQDLDKINTHTKLEYKIEQPNTGLILETSEAALDAIKAATISAKSVAESSAKVCSDMIKKQEKDNEKIKKNKSKMLENIVEAAVATSVAAKIASKIDKYGNDVSKDELVSTDDEDTEELIENLLEKQTIQKTEMSDKRKLNTVEVSKLEAFNNKVETAIFDAKDKVDDIAEDIATFTQENVEKVKELVDVIVKNIKKSTNMVIKRGAKTTDIKSRINLIFSDVMQLKNESEIIVHLFKDGLDNIVEDIKTSSGEVIELVSHYVFSYFENLVKNVVKLRENKVDLNSIKLELFEELIDQISPIGYKIKDKIDDFYETVMCRNGENQPKSYSPRFDSKRNSLNISSLDEREEVKTSPIYTNNLTYNDNIQNFIQIDKIYRKVMEEFEKKYEDLNEKFEFSVSRNADINAVREEFKNLKNGCDEELKKIGGELSTAEKTLNEKLSNFEESVKKIEKEYNEEVEETQTLINNLISDLDSSIENKEKEIARLFEDLQQNSVAYLKNQVNDYKDKVNAVGAELKEISDSIVKLTEETEEKFNELTEDIGDEIIEAKNNFKLDLEALIKESINISNNKLIELYEKGLKYKKEIEESNEKSKNDLAKYISTFIENAKSKLNNTFSVKTIENKITTFMDKVFRDNYDISQEKIVKDVMEKSMEKIEDNIAKRNAESVDIYVEIEKAKDELKKFVIEQLEKQHNEFLILLDIQNKLGEFELKFENKLKDIENKFMIELKRKEPIDEAEIERIINKKSELIVNNIVNTKKGEIKEFNNQITDKLKNEIEEKFEETSTAVKNNINDYAQTILERDFIETYESCIEDLNVKVDAVKAVISTALNGETITNAKLEKILNDLNELTGKLGSIDGVKRVIVSQTLNNNRNFKKIEKKVGK